MKRIDTAFDLWAHDFTERHGVDSLAVNVANILKNKVSDGNKYFGRTKLTPHVANICFHIYMIFRQKFIPPVTEDIAKEIGYTSNSGGYVGQLVKILVELGILERTSNKFGTRYIKVSEQFDN